MRLTLKHQIIMAPAAVLCLMTLLLGFLQFTYWDLSLKRQQAKDLKTAYIAIAEADLATQRLHGAIALLSQQPTPDPQILGQMADLHFHLGEAIGRLEGSARLAPATLSLLQQAVADLDPQRGMHLEQFRRAVDLLRPQLKTLQENLNDQRQLVAQAHRQDIDELVAQTTFVTIVVLGIAILVGIVLSMTFARHILRRIHTLSNSAERITRGEFDPPPVPETVRDEIDGLTVSINRMTDQLIRVVAAEKLLEGAEEERRRIAMDIHDQTLSDLSSVRRGLEQLQESSSCSEQAGQIGKDLERAIGNLRVVMDNLHPQTLDILGLPSALESHLNKVCLNQDCPDFHFIADDTVNDQALTKLAQVTLYRIAVEAIHNVIRHAHANTLEVSLSIREAKLILSVEDNGHGFDYKPTPPGQAGGRGLHNILERARAIGAEAHWGPSRFSSGTRFELTLPLGEPS